MGCNISFCNDPNELILSQNIPPMQISSPTSQKSTFLSVYGNKEDTMRLLRSSVKSLLGELMNYSDMIQLLESWLSEVFSELSEVFPEDVKTIVSLESCGNLKILHTVDGARDFSCIYKFASQVNSRAQITKIPVFNQGRFQQFERFLMTLSPLTIFFYLTLGPDFDCGIGVSKPMNKKQLDMFLVTCNQKHSIANWLTASNQPIPTSFAFSCFYDKRTVSFYLFDSHKAQNFSKAFHLFDSFGVPLSPDLKKAILKSKAEEVECSLDISKERILAMDLEVNDISQFSNVLKLIDTQYSIANIDRFATSNKPSKLSIKLKPEGYTLSAISHL